jgi:GTP pyrophosphokinase
MAIYQDRIFAFTPKGALFQLPKGATAVDFAFAVHTNLGMQTAGVKINGRHMPLRTPLANGDVCEIIKNPSASPQLSWLAFVVTGKARAAIRRAVRMKERAEVATIGSKLFDEIAARVPARIGKKAIRAAVERLGMEEPDDLMYAIGAAKVTDREVMEALVPGCTADIQEDEHWERRERAISITGLTPGVAFDLASCCHPVPGDRIVGIRRKGEPVLVHAIDCMELANGVDSDWIDLAWGNQSSGATGQLSVTIYDRLGTLAEMAGIFAQNKANIITLMQAHIDHPFVTYDVEVEVEDSAHLNRIISALRASDAVAQAERQ